VRLHILTPSNMTWLPSSPVAGFAACAHVASGGTTVVRVRVSMDRRLSLEYAMDWSVDSVEWISHFSHIVTLIVAQHEFRRVCFSTYTPVTLRKYSN
jgi:hypothetical protein